jgi:hypothetical protein
MELSEEDVERMTMLFNKLGMNLKTDSNKDFKAWIMGISEQEVTVKTDATIKK